MPDEAPTTAENVPLVPEVSLGELIRCKRKSNVPALSQKDVAVMFGVHQSSVAKWERTGSVNIDRLDEIAEWLGLTFEEAYRASKRPPMSTDMLVELIETLGERLARLEAKVEALSPAEAPRARRAPAKRAAAATR